VTIGQDVEVDVVAAIAPHKDDLCVLLALQTGNAFPPAARYDESQIYPKRETSFGFIGSDRHDAPGGQLLPKGPRYPFGKLDGVAVSVLLPDGDNGPYADEAFRQLTSLHGMGPNPNISLAIPRADEFRVLGRVPDLASKSIYEEIHVAVRRVGSDF